MSTKKSYWLKSGFFSIGERLSWLVFGFGSVFLLLRTLSKEEFGVWVLFLTVSAFIEVARAGLLQNALVKYLTTAEDEEYAKISTASFILNIILTLLSIILLAGLAYPLSRLWSAPDLSKMLFLYIFTTSMLMFMIHFNSIQQAKLDFSGKFWGNFVRQGSFFSYILIIFFMGKPLNLIGLALLQIFCALAGAIVSWWLCRPYLRHSRKIDWPWVKKLFDFGKYVFGTNLSTMLYKNIDKMMLGSMLSPVSVALYELAIKITNLAEVPTFSIASIVFPQSARKMETEGMVGIKKLYEKSVGAIIALIVPFILVVLLIPEWIITIVASEKYLDAVPLLQLTMLYGLFIPFAVQFGTVLDSIGQPKVNFYFTAVGMILNIIFNYIFISLFGVVGAAYGTLTTYFIAFILMQVLLHRRIGVNPLNALVNAVLFYGEIYKFAKGYLDKIFASSKQPTVLDHKPSTENIE